MAYSEQRIWITDSIEPSKLEAVLNRRTKEGWRINKILPLKAFAVEWHIFMELK